MKYVVSYLAVFVMLITYTPTNAAQSSCSQNGSGVEMFLSVPNFTDEKLDVYWIDYQCNEQLIAVVEPGKVFYQTTYDGHQWVFRNKNGQDVEQFTASVSTPLVVLGGAYNPEPVTSNCSNNGTDEQQKLTVINNTQEPLLVFWIAFDCSEELYHGVDGKDRIVQETFIGHDWVVRYPDGRTAKHLTISAADNTVIIDPPPAAAATAAPSSDTTTDTATETTTETTEVSFPITVSECEVAPVTADMKLADFYKKYCDYKGLIIVSSDGVDDAALQQTWLVMANVLYNRSDVVESLVKMNFKLVVIADDENNSDLPEFADLANDPSANIDNFRAYAKVLEEPRLVSVPEENLLCMSDDSNRGESLLVDTLATLTRFALVRDLEPEMADKVEAVRQNAITKGLWSSPAWVTESNGSYWNYGVQTYFNSSFDALLTGPTDDYINTRDELAGYDAQLYNLIDEVYGSEDWTPACPTE